MTNTQIHYLKSLGYETAQEDGAVLVHPKLNGIYSYVWKGDKFQDILEEFPDRYRNSYLKKIVTRLVYEL